MRSAVLSALLVAVVGLHLTAAEPSSIKWHEKLPTSQKSKPVLLYFTTSGCAYCIKMKKGTLTDREVVRRVQKDYVAVSIDGRKHAQIVKQLKVKLYPTTAIVHPSGTVVELIPGYVKPHEFLSRLSSAKQKLDYQTKLLAAKKKQTMLK